MKGGSGFYQSKTPERYREFLRRAAIAPAGAPLRDPRRIALSFVPAPPIFGMNDSTVSTPHQEHP
jgi:hypothetical protein